MMQSDPPPIAGSVQVGSELWRSLGQIHTRANAHREQLENAMSAGASCITFELARPAKLGASDGAGDMLCVFTDTAIDLSVALDIGHSKEKDAAAPVVRNKGALNNFGIGLKVFQASLGLQTQVTIFTYQRFADGGESLVAARMGSAIDAHFAALSKGKVVHMGRIIVRLLKAANGELSFDWGAAADEAKAAENKAAMLGAHSPWASEAAALRPMRQLMQLVREQQKSRGTLFVYHTDGSVPLPYRLVHPIAGADGSESDDDDDDADMAVCVKVEAEDDAAADDLEEVHEAELVAPPPRLAPRLEVCDKDGTWKDVARCIERSYISDDVGALHALAAAEGAPLPAAPAMPRVSVQGLVLSFAEHAWCAEQRRDGAAVGAFFPIRVQGVDTPIAFARCVHMDLRNEERRQRGSTTAPRLWLHKQLRDGAFFVLHGRKVVNDEASAMWHGGCFEEATSKFDPFLKLAIHGGQGEMNYAKYGLLKEYWAAGCDEAAAAPLPPELQYANAKKWKPKASHLWPKVGAGVLALVHLSPEFFELDPSKTRVLRRDGGEATTNLTLGSLVSAIRTGLALWCATTPAPEHPAPRPNPRPAAPRNVGSSSAAAPAGSSAGGASSSSSLTPSPGEEIVGRRISIFWAQDRRWYDGLVDDYEVSLHHITYDDGDDEWLRLVPEEYELLVRDQDGSGAELPAAQRADGRVRRRTTRPRAVDSYVDYDAPSSKRVARSKPAHADAHDAIQFRKAAKAAYREQNDAICRSKLSGDMLLELQAYRKAFEALDRVLK